MEARMLVLTRKTNESIMIGEDVEVTVLAVSRDKIRLGIDAPKDVPIFRKEVWLSINEGRVDVGDGAEHDGADGRGEIEVAIIDGAAAEVEEALGSAKSDT
jgi:carbon storage regulator